MRIIHVALTVCLALWLAFSPGKAGEMGMGHNGGHMVGGEVFEPWTAEQDATFLSAMIAHHEGALEMAAVELKYGTEGQVREWATAVVAAQTDEIALMRKLLEKIGPEDKAAADTMKSEMQAMLKNPLSDNPDQNFVLQMAPHHAGAITMSLPPLTLSSSREVRKLAKNIIQSQAGEIAAFMDWLETREEKLGKGQ